MDAKTEPWIQTSCAADVVIIQGAYGFTFGALHGLIAGTRDVYLNSTWREPVIAAKYIAVRSTRHSFYFAGSNGGMSIIYCTVRNLRGKGDFFSNMGITGAATGAIAQMRTRNPSTIARSALIGSGCFMAISLPLEFLNARSTELRRG